MRGGAWQKAKRRTTSYAKGSGTAAGAVGSFVGAHRGGDGRLRTGGPGARSATRAGQALGALLGSVAEHGLEEALRRSGLSELVGRTPSEVLSGLVDHICGDGADLDDATARAAMVEVLADNRPGLMMGYWMGGIPMVPWWRVKAQSGGQAAEQTIHHFDTARYLFGEVEVVHAVSSKGLVTDLEGYDVEDASAVNLQFASGLCGTIFSSCFAGARNRSGIDIWCKNVSLEYTERTSLRTTRRDGDEEFMTVKNDAVAAIDDAFIAAIKAGDQSLVKSSYADAARSLQVVLAANESMETGEAVRLG